MIKVATVVLNYNDFSTTIGFVENIKHYDLIEKIIIIDNCSTDDSYEKFLEIVDDKVVVYRTTKNGGYGFGNNYGVKIAKSLGFKYSIISNPDVSFGRELIYKIISYMESNSNIAIASATQKDINNNIIDNVAWKIPSKFEAALYTTKISRKLGFCKYEREYFEKNEVCKVDCLPGAFLVVNIDNFLNVGGYDEKIFLYCEEVTIGFKVINNGFSSVLFTKDYYQHNHSVSINKSLPKIRNRMKLVKQNRLYFMREYLKANKVICFLANIFFEFDIIRSTIKGSKL